MNANYKSIILATSLFFALCPSISAAPGDLDLTFGSGGIVFTRDSTLGAFDYASGMAIQADGKIVVVGEGSRGSFNWDFAVVRYNPDGSLDTSFGGSGIVITQLTGDYDGASSVAIQADGKIVVAGSRYDGAGGSSFAVVRYNPNGSLDTSFNGTGIVITSVGSSRDYAQSVAIQADGKIVVAGGSGFNDFAIVRYNRDGSLDTTFNGTGRVITPVGGGASSVAIQADGKIVAAGGDALVRYHTDGTLDTSFNGTGKVITPIASNSAAIQTDGKIVVAGGASSNNIDGDFAVVRLNPNGSLDTTFNGTGKVITQATAGNDILTGAAIQADGKIVVAGVSGSDFYDFVVVRYLGDPATPGCPNPIDCADFFVRQHYFDFLNREPDPAGYAAWQEVINGCAQGDTTCDRIHVSSAFFRSPEFQGRGYFVYRFYPVAFGRKPDYNEFTPDLARVSGFLSDAELETAKTNFIAEFMSRPMFVSRFLGLSDTEYVDTLLSSADITHPARDSWIAALGNGTRTRAQVLREIAESNEVYNKYYNQAFVVMQYFGYLRRQPDALYLNWIAHLDGTGDYRSMIDGFVSSAEYRRRFGP
jgi:uncharacterized delta-60 repeat protein